MVKRLLIGCSVSLAMLAALSLQVAQADQPGKCKPPGQVSKCDSAWCAGDFGLSGGSLAAIAHEFSLAPVFKACTKACGFTTKCATPDKCDVPCPAAPTGTSTVSACECVVAPAKKCDGAKCTDKCVPDAARSCAAARECEAPQCEAPKCEAPKCEGALAAMRVGSTVPRIIVRAIKTCSGCACGGNCACDEDSKCGAACKCDGSQPAEVVVHTAVTRCPAGACPVTGKVAASPTKQNAGECPARHCPVMSGIAARCGEAKPWTPQRVARGFPVPTPVPLLPPPPHMQFPPMHAPQPALLDKMMALTVENARLAAEAKARDELAKQREMFLAELVESRIDNARLAAQLEMVDQRDELVEQLVETMVEKARLEGHAHSVEERTAMAVELAHKETLPTAMHPAMAEVMRELAKFREENQRLRAEVTELQQRLEASAARTAERAVAPDLEAELTAPR